MIFLHIWIFVCMLQVLGAYLEYMTKTGVLLGGEENDTRDQMLDVIEFETRLANVSEGIYYLLCNEIQENID